MSPAVPAGRSVMDQRASLMRKLMVGAPPAVPGAGAGAGGAGPGVGAGAGVGASLPAATPVGAGRDRSFSAFPGSSGFAQRGADKNIKVSDLFASLGGSVVAVTTEDQEGYEAPPGASDADADAGSGSATGSAGAPDASATAVGATAGGGGAVAGPAGSASAAAPTPQQQQQQLQQQQVGQQVRRGSTVGGGAIPAQPVSVGAKSSTALRMALLHRMQRPVVTYEWTDPLTQPQPPAGAAGGEDAMGGGAAAAAAAAAAAPDKAGAGGSCARVRPARGCVCVRVCERGVWWGFKEGSVGTAFQALFDTLCDVHALWVCALASGPTMHYLPRARLRYGCGLFMLLLAATLDTVEPVLPCLALSCLLPPTPAPPPVVFRCSCQQGGGVG
jgi:hypothetical protein